MPKFLCRNEEDGPEEDAEVDAGSKRAAAERYAAWRDANGLEYPLSSEVRVQSPDGTVSTFDVEMRAKPVYTARRKRATRHTSRGK